MDNLQKLNRQIRQNVFVIILLNNLFIVAGCWIGIQLFNLGLVLVLVIMVILSFVLDVLLSSLITKYFTEPITYLWNAILYVNPDHSGVGAPNLEKAKVGKELINSLVMQVYQLAGEIKVGQQPSKVAILPKSILDDFPLPVFVMNKQQVITATNKSAQQYLNLLISEISNKPLNEVLNMSFSNSGTYESWLNNSRASKVTDNASWNRVRTTLNDQKTVKQFDLSAYYDKDNSSGIETIITLFDRTSQYTQDDDAMSYVALVVHELRTPLTVLRGYIEVLEEKTINETSSEITNIIQMIQASSQQLATFITNILNVARVEENQLTLKLYEENWKDIVKSAGANMQLRASVRGIKIEYEIESTLPTVAVDRVSIYEVIYNLLDNAIKYSGDSDRIVVKASLNKSGMVETTVQDFGVGIQNTALPNLFEKYYRNHQNEAQISGTGLGLFLCKSLVSAHGGQIWVKSSGSKGSLFGFSLQQYSKLAENLKNNDNNGIVRVAHGWIKNHSLYRR